MNQKGVASIILVVVVIILLGAVGYFAFVRKRAPVAQQTSTTTTQNPTPTPTPTSTANPVNNTKVYPNTALGFQLTLPNRSWTMPTATDSDPHLYANEECFNSDKPNCAALEIQNYDGEFSQGPDATFTALKTDGQNPVRLPPLISEAIVIKSDAPGATEGWSYQYDIFFKTAKKRFLIFTNSETLEKDVLPSFKLAN